MTDDAAAEGDDGPDLGLVVVLGTRMPDKGPRYKETPADPFAADAPPIAEPFNTVTAAVFVLIAIAWIVRLRSRFGQFPFVASCLPILLAGGVGGTLYHATRTRPVYFYLDVIPISLLGIAGAAYLAIRRWRLGGVLYLFGSLVGYVGFSAAFFALLAPLPALKPFKMLAVNISYAVLAAVILIPLGATLIRSRFRHVGLVAAGLASFAIAWFCRLVDGSPLSDLPMGTHWLWHLFGAAATGFVVEYFYRVEGEPR